MTIPRIDVEWLAFKAGVKPAIRISAEPGSSLDIVARFSDAGASVVTRSGFMGEAREQRVLIYVARTIAEAEELRDIEAPLVRLGKHSPGKLEVENTSKLGIRLGYPACCVDAFSGRLAKRAAFRDPFDPVDDFVAARAAWVSRPDPRLNNLLLPVNARIITFEPCSYQCARALAFADSVLELALAHDPPSGRALLNLLSRDVVIAPDGVRAVVLQSAGGSIRSASSLAEICGRTPEPPERVFAAALPAARVYSDGAVIVSGWPDSLLVAFGGAPG
ncbi:MAG TPA: hypothetical protein VG937_10450 [Polyangiaceae bacterium]|nr:hypothetical protein [Polyangiaceae bacterium]